MNDKFIVRYARPNRSGRNYQAVVDMLEAFFKSNKQTFVFELWTGEQEKQIEELRRENAKLQSMLGMKIHGIFEDEDKI